PLERSGRHRNAQASARRLVRRERDREGRLAAAGPGLPVLRAEVPVDLPGLRAQLWPGARPPREPAGRRALQRGIGTGQRRRTAVAVAGLDLDDRGLAGPDVRAEHARGQLELARTVGGDAQARRVEGALWRGLAVAWRRVP